MDAKTATNISLKQNSKDKQPRTSLSSSKQNKLKTRRGEKISKSSEKLPHKNSTMYMGYSTKSKYKLIIRPPGMQKSVLIKDMQIAAYRNEDPEPEKEIKPFRQTLAPSSPGVFNYGFSHRMMAFDDYRSNRPLPKIEHHMDSRMLAAALKANQYVHNNSIAFPEMPIYKHFVDKTSDRPIRAPRGYRFKCAVCMFNMDHCQCPEVDEEHEVDLVIKKDYHDVLETKKEPTKIWQRRRLNWIIDLENKTYEHIKKHSFNKENIPEICCFPFTTEKVFQKTKCNSR